MTTGQWMVYGGLGLIMAGIVAICLYIPLFSRQRKKLEKKIMEDYTEK